MRCLAKVQRITDSSSTAARIRELELALAKANRTIDLYNLLQAEKDEHLQSRLDRDHWHAQTMKVCGMIRHAYRLRCDEWNEELAIISGLQNEVRVYRNAMGMEKERPEDETGWPYLKDAPLNLQGIDET